MLSIVESIVFGFLQGLLEWLPISSSGQGFILLFNYLKLDPSKAFAWATILHVGTLIAVILKFRVEILEILKETSEFKIKPLTKFLIISSFFSFLSGGIIYLFFKKTLSLFPGELATGLVGMLLVITGIVLYVSRNKFGTKSVEDISLFDTITVGVVQGFSALPGISRSGVTLASLLLSELKADEALKLSFLMSIPSVGGMVFIEILSEGLPDKTPLILLGVLASFLTGYFTMEVLLKISRKLRFDYFCILFGLIAAVSGLYGFI